MGSLCCKPDPDSFATPGRVLGAAPPTGPRTSYIPKNVSSHKLSNSVSNLDGIVSASGTPGGKSAPKQAQAENIDVNDARRRAAEAAERRLNASKNKAGKLAANMNANKNKTQAELLHDASAQERQTRELDANAEALRHD